MKILSDKELDKLMVLINEHGLEPTWMNYGGFSKLYKAFNHHPDHREEREHLEGMYGISVGTIIYQVTDDKYSTYITPEQHKRFDALVSEIKEREQFKKDLLYAFNSYTYEFTVYSRAFIDVSWGQNWYTTNKMGAHLPLDASKDRDDGLRAEAEYRAKKMVAHMEKNGKTVDGYQVCKVYTDVHYLKEEWNEILNMGKSFHDNHPTHQSRRASRDNVSHRIDDFMPVTLKSTGRKMLMEMNGYGWNFIETEPVVK